MNNKQIWQATLDRLRQQTTKPIFETWLRGTKLISAQDQYFIVGVPNTFARQWIEAHLLYSIKDALTAITGTETDVAIKVLNAAATNSDEEAENTVDYAVSGTLWAQTKGNGSTSEESKSSVTMLPNIPSAMPANVQLAPSTPAVAPAPAPVKSPGVFPPHPLLPNQLPTPLFSRTTTVPVKPQASPWFDPKLNPRYRFETFIVGKSNELAHAAAAAAAAQPGHAYNPLFFWGGVGLGKTHLLHAIGHVGVQQQREVLYVSSENFTNEIIQAIRAKTTDAFRSKYRTVDVLLIDDIQFIAGKDSTEEEFFHTFNALYESEKQIVICSDRPPKAIVTLEERLRSRFEWGLTADIIPPDFETRVAILRDKAEQLHCDIPYQVIDYIANHIRSNIRELEGCLNRVLAYSSLNQVPLTLDLAKTAIESLLPDSRSRSLTPIRVLETVATYFKVSLADLKGKQRDKEIVIPRQICMYLMRQHTEASLLEIGQLLGGRDHSTVLHGYEKINSELPENTALRRDILAIQEHLIGAAK